MPHEKLTKQVLLLTPTGKRPRVPPRTRWSEYIPELDWFRLRVETAEPSEIAEDRGGISSPPRAAAPRDPPHRKRGFEN